MFDHRTALRAASTSSQTLSNHLNNRPYKSRFFKKPLAKAIIVLSLASPLLSAADAMARAGRGRSSGRSMNRSAPRAPLYSAPAAPRNTPPAAPMGAPAPSTYGNNNAGPYRQPPMAPPSAASGGGFLRNMGGAVAGGFLGSMLFSGVSRAFNGSGGQSAGLEGGAGGVGAPGTAAPRGGIGFLEMLLFGGLAYLGYRYWKSRQEKLAYDSSGSQSFGADRPHLSSLPSYRTETTPFLSDPSIGSEAMEEQAEAAMQQVARDIFYRVQTAWSRRDLTAVGPLMTAEMKATLSRDLDELVRDKKFNRLENISITDIDVVKSWEEAGEICCSVKITAYMLDYTLDEVTQQVLMGSQQDPIRFQEIWTFSKSRFAPTSQEATKAGADGWSLSGIEQTEDRH